MPNLAHFSINADDLPRARRFYENVFGWKFVPWGPPGFFQIDMGPVTRTEPVLGALQQRRALLPGVVLHGFECTIAVADVKATKKAIEENGGKIVMQIVTLPGIGDLLFFQDPEGNLAGAMQYDNKAD